MEVDESVARSEEEHEESKEEETLVTTAVLVDDASNVSAIVENRLDGSTTIIPNQDVSNMTIERVVMDGPDDPDREAPMLVEAEAVEKETIQGLCRNRKVQLMFLLVI